MRERGIPDSGSAAKASKLGNQSQFPMPQQIPGIPGTDPPATPTISEPAGSVSEEPSVKAQTAGQDRSAGLPSERATPMKKSPTTQPNSPGTLQRWSKSWQFWTLLASIGTTGVGWIAVALLLKLPAVPNCPSMFWPTASASMRLYCAQVAANKQTVKDLLEAIALVQSLPKDHPLREEIDRQMAEWSEDILNLAEKSFHGGKLEEAIATAKQIPEDVPAYKLVENRIAQWRGIWSKAEGIYRETEAQVRKLEWNQAFRVAVRLLGVGNTYWETTKYDELNQLIETAREDGEKIAKAKQLVDRGGVKNFLEAIKLAQSVGQKSYVYEAAQKLIPEVGRKMLDLAEAQVARKDLEAALETARQIPAIASLKAEVEDFINITQAQVVAKEGTSSSVAAAIAQAQKIGSDRPLYSKAQNLITNWQRELEDIARLEKARQLAQLGTVSDLTSAIAQARLIPAYHPRAQEAKAEIGRWQAQIQTMEDRPFLNRADQLAATGDEASLQAAVDEVSKIASGRALSQEAQNKRRQWVSQIQRMQDQPYLDQARQLASGGNLPEAIAVAQQIRPGRTLSGEAQGEISDWQGQLRAAANWQEANRLASGGTPDALAAAIRVAQRISGSSGLRGEAQNAANQWGYQILSMAQERASYDLVGAIAIAGQIPGGTSAYGEARVQMQNWQNLLNPPPAPAPAPVAPAPVAPAPAPAPVAPAPATPEPEAVAPPSEPNNLPQPSPPQDESSPPPATSEQ